MGKLEHTIIIVDGGSVGSVILKTALDEGNVVLRADSFDGGVVYVLARVKESPIETLPSGIQLQ